jgi:hypothetical protein
MAFPTDETKLHPKKPYEVAHKNAYLGRCDISMDEVLIIEKAFLVKIRENLPVLRKLLDKVNNTYEDSIYRFYHQSFKVYSLQKLIQEIEAAFDNLKPDPKLQLNAYLAEIFKNARDIGAWEVNHNADWLAHTMPILDAFFHTKYFLEMLIKYSAIEPTDLLPSGWAAVLCLFYLR